MTATVIFDLRQAQDLAYPTTFGLLGIAILMLLLWGILYPFRARINATLFESLRPMGLTLAVCSLAPAACEYRDIQANLALADRYDAGKGEAIEGVISEIKPPREEQMGKISSWVRGSFDLDGTLIFYEHGMPVENNAKDGDRIRVTRVGEAIVRIEKLAGN